jgi:hypothetical protein
MSKSKQPPLESGLMQAMTALDKQITREISSRDPQRTQTRGASARPAQEERAEQVTTFVIDLFASHTVRLDSILVLSEALTHSLQLISEELGQEGLGEVRSAYVTTVAKRLEQFSRRMQQNTAEGMNTLLN